MWPFPKNRRFVDDLIVISDGEPGAWKIVNEYRVNFHNIDFWVASGSSHFQPCGGKIPSLRFFERRRLWRAFQRSNDRVTLAEFMG